MRTPKKNDAYGATIATMSSPIASKHNNYDFGDDDFSGDTT